MSKNWKEMLSKESDQSVLNELLHLREENQKLKEQIQKSKKIGIIYGFKHKIYGTMDYVGSHTGEDVFDRVSSHITDLCYQVKVPFYKFLMQQLLDIYEVIVLKQFEFQDKQELLLKEKKYQLKYKSFQSSESFHCHKCEQKFKYPKKLHKHRKICYNIDSMID